MRNQLFRRVSVALAATAGLVLAGGACSSTQMTNTWTDPGATGKPLSKVAVVCMAKDQAVRRMAEDEVAGQLGGRVVPSYRVLEGMSLKDRPAVKARLTQDGFDGVLVMRLGGVSEQITPGVGPYASFGGYYDWAYSSAYAPEVDTVVRVMSSVYSLPDEKMIWAGSSQTFDPNSVKDVLDGVTKAVAKELQKNRLIL
jgi:hypothetical protein